MSLLGVDPLEPLLMACFRQRGFAGAVGKVVADGADGVQGLLDRRRDQTQPCREADLRSVAAEGTIGGEQFVVGFCAGGHHRLEQVLEGKVQPGGTHQHQTPPTLHHHLHGHVAGLLGGCQGARIRAHSCWP